MFAVTDLRCAGPQVACLHGSLGPVHHRLDDPRPALPRCDADASRPSRRVPDGQDTYTIPSVTGVDYLVGGLVKAPAPTPVWAQSSSRPGRAGYVLTGPASWTLSFTSTACSATVAGAPPCRPRPGPPLKPPSHGPPPRPPGTAIAYDVQFRSVTLSPTGSQLHHAHDLVHETTTTTATLTGSVGGVYQVRREPPTAMALSGPGRRGSPSPCRSTTPRHQLRLHRRLDGGIGQSLLQRHVPAHVRRRSQRSPSPPGPTRSVSSAFGPARAGRPPSPSTGSLKATIDAYGATAAYRQTLAAITVPYGKHTITVTNPRDERATPPHPRRPRLPADSAAGRGPRRVIRRTGNSAARSGSDGVSPAP